jgi:hypothetical protein
MPFKNEFSSFARASLFGDKKTRQPIRLKMPKSSGYMLDRA